MRFAIFLSALTAITAAAELKVATLHPLLADLSKEVGGDRITVVELVEKNADPHHFEPTPQQIKEAGDIDLCLASGMGLESYLPALRSLLPAKAKLIEVGASIPGIEGSCNHPDHHHHHDHDHGLDPHWWHSIDAFRRAATITAEAFATADPEGAEHYQSLAKDYRAQLDELERWTKRQLVKVARERRILPTAHAAFAYFCRDFGFEAVPVQGVNREQMPDAKTLAELITKLKQDKVPAIFPEKSSNPKILQALTVDTGIQLAPPLIADGTTTDSYEEMVRYNVTTIVEALAK